MDTRGGGMTNGEREPAPAPKVRRKGPMRLISRTLGKAWEGNIFSESAEAAFWQTLSLPPLLLGLLGSLGFIGEWFGEHIVRLAYDKIIGFSETVFSGSVVHQIIGPTVNDILTTGKGEIVSVGFIISLWAGSSAMSSFVDAITVAHDQYGVRNEVWQRIFALLLYLASLILLVGGLPIIAIGPDLLPKFFPTQWEPAIAWWLGALYYPTVGVLLVLALATLYKVALPRKLPWHRGLPGAVLAMIIFLLSSIGLRFYIAWITTTGYTYGALATPIAFLLFMFFIGMAIVGGSYFNSAIQELWPAKMTRRQRRKWRRLEMERANERLRSQDENFWQRTTMPLRRPRSAGPGDPADATGARDHPPAGEGDGGDTGDDRDEPGPAPTNGDTDRAGAHPAAPPAPHRRDPAWPETDRDSRDDPSRGAAERPGDHGADYFRPGGRFS